MDFMTMDQFIGKGWNNADINLVLWKVKTGWSLEKGTIPILMLIGGEINGTSGILLTSHSNVHEVLILRMKDP
jgi:hypothetical protein